MDDSNNLETAWQTAVPCLTADLPGIGGRIKVQPEDFIVEELPLYQPCGEGEHLYLWIEKRDVSGERLVEHVARRLGVRRDEIGVAGLKDRRAATRQYLSVPRRVEERLNEIDGEGVQCLRATPHRNKLRTGHLAGNRFDVLVRDVNDGVAALLAPLLTRLSSQGFPNAFGEQRFGQKGETLELGLALLRGETSPSSIPYRRRRFLLRLALSSVQSLLFNRVLARRITAGLLHTVQAGDVMQVVASGGCFVVEDAAAEQERFDQRETVLAGPLFGPKMKRAEGRSGACEARCLSEAGLTSDHFGRYAKLLPGARRPLLVWPQDLSCAVESSGVRLRFTLPSGAYATTLLREVTKVDLSDS